MRAVSPKRYAADRAFIREGIGRYRNSKAVASALALAETLLNYTPDHGWTWQYHLQTRVEKLRAAGVRPADVLQRVAEHFALTEREPHLFKTQRAERIALARHVLRLVQGNGHPSTRLLLQFGQMLAEDLGLFAMQLLRRLHQDLANRQALRRSSAVEFDQEAGQ